MKLYIKDPKRTNVKEFIDDYFNRSRPFTFSDEKCSMIQCGPGKRRSFTDLLALVNTYFPGTTKKELACILIDKIKALEIVGTYCTTIRRVVFTNGTANRFYDAIYRTYSKGAEDGISIEDIENYAKAKHEAEAVS